MAELRVGEQVFDENGQPCTITYATDVILGRPCFDVVFDDGTLITVDAEHEWLTWTHRARKSAGRGGPGRGAVVSTAHIAATLLYNGRERNHSIPTCGVVAYAPKALPIEPYTLGAWLGDGSSKTAAITGVDPAILASIRAAGYDITPYNVAATRAPTYGIGTRVLRRDPTTGRMLANGSVHSQLKALGLLNNKHIPRPYLEASPDQRLALMQGLMDTDGSVTPGGHCEYVTTRGVLATDVRELLLSLGLKPTLLQDRARVAGRDCGPRYRLTFTPHSPVFRLQRKLERQHAGKAQRTRTHQRYITEVRPRPSVPVRCIEVDSPSHLYLCSRSFIPTHNTRTGAEWVRAKVEAGLYGRFALVAPTASDVRDVMVEGESGLLAISPPWCRPRYESSKRRLTWPNGAIATTYSADEPNRLRGPQHDAAWADEVAAWSYPEAFDQLQFGLRLGRDPRCLVTTTPRPVRLVRELLADPTTATTRGSTYDNAANLAPAFLRQVTRRYEGTRLGRQELFADLLEDVPGALWQRSRLDEVRVRTPDSEQAPRTYARIVVAIDPAMTSGDDADHTGIVVAARGEDGHGYVLADLTCRLSPDGWARAAVRAYQTYGADRIVAEVNNGGDLVEATVRTVDPAVSYKAVRASRGKRVRAEPVAALYEQGQVHHVGALPDLEDQMCGYVPDVSTTSPDRVDALVWALSDLMLSGGPVCALDEGLASDLAAYRGL